MLPLKGGQFKQQLSSWHRLSCAHEYRIIFLETWQEEFEVRFQWIMICHVIQNTCKTPHLIEDLHHGLATFLVKILQICAVGADSGFCLPLHAHFSRCLGPSVPGKLQNSEPFQPNCCGSCPLNTPSATNITYRIWRFVLHHVFSFLTFW